MTDVTVNGEVIPEDAILAEMQYHPADSADDAQAAAAEALVVRALLLQRARALGLGDDASEDTELIQEVIEREVDVPEPDEETCRRYYQNNQRRFNTPDLYEAAHILLPAPPEDEDKRTEAKSVAERLIRQLQDRPDRFGALACEYSACSSRDNDGRLGQVARGDTVPEFETFLDNIEEGQLCPVPVPTRYGFHVLRVDKKVPGHHLPFEAVRDKIAEYLKEQSWRRAFSQYVQLLAGDAEISGIAIARADSPLVQ